MRHLTACGNHALVLDHVGNWLPDAERARQALRDHGFCVTPFSEQRQKDSRGRSVPAGAGNHCVMLEFGYLEFLTPLADTPIGNEIRAGMARYIGTHIAAFGSDDAAKASVRLDAEGFRQQSPVALRRSIDDANGQPLELAFTVARPLPPGMPEGRFQVLTHHTPESLWQARWLTHENSVRGLTGMVVKVSSLKEAVARFERWTGVGAVACAGGVLLELAFGAVVLTDAQGIDQLMPGASALPTGIVASFLEARDPALLGAPEDVRGIRWLAAGPDLGGVWGVLPEGVSLARALDAELPG